MVRKIAYRRGQLQLHALAGAICSRSQCSRRHYQHDGQQREMLGSHQVRSGVHCSQRQVQREDIEPTTDCKETLLGAESVVTIILVEGTFGIMKYGRRYKRIVRRGLDSIMLEIFLVSIAHNLYKYSNKAVKRQLAA